MRRYETVRAKQIKRIVAMTRREVSTAYGPLLMRAVPDRVATAIYARLIEGSSSVLTDHSRARAHQSHGLVVPRPRESRWRILCDKA